MDIDEERLQEDIPVDSGMPEMQFAPETTPNNHRSMTRTSMNDGSPIKSAASYNTSVSQKRSYLKNTYQEDDGATEEVYPRLESSIMRILFKVFVGIASGCYAVAAFILVVNVQYKTYPSIIFYISMIVVLACACALTFERPEISAAITGAMRFLAQEEWLCIYLAANLLLSDWGFATPIMKASSAFLVVAGVAIVGLVVILVLSIFNFK